MKTTDTKTNRAIARNAENVILRKDFIRCWLHANPKVDKTKASRLYDALCARFPELSRGGHRGMVGRINPWESLKHECPCCAKQAEGVQGIKEAFGLRLVTYQTKAGEKSKVYFQSHCRTCRSNDTKSDNGNKRINPEVQKFWTNESDARQ